MLLKNRRILSLSLALIFGVLSAEMLPHGIKPFLAVSLGASAFFLLLFVRRHRPLRACLLAMLLLTAAVLSSMGHSGKREQLLPLDESTLTVAVTVTYVSHTDENGSVAEGISYLPVGEDAVHARVSIKSDTLLSAGDILFGKAAFTLAETDSSLVSDGLYGTLRFDGSARVTGRTWSPEILLGQLRTSLCERIRTALPGESGELLTALLLGERDGLSAGFERNMSRIGTSHILSLSGLHLAVLTAGLTRLLRHIRMDYRLRFLLSAGFALFFIFLTGLSASVMRAGFMFILSVFPLLLREERDSISALFLAVALILLLTPYAAGDLGLWLSAFSTLGILLFFHRIRLPRGEKGSVLGTLGRGMLLSLSITLAATLATLPLTLYRFGTVALLSPLANLVLGPLTQIALYLAILIILLGAFSPVTAIAQALCNVIFAFSRFLADIPHTVITVQGTAHMILPIFFALLILLYFCLCPRRRFRLRVPVALFLAVVLSLSLPLAVARIGQSRGLTLIRYTEKSGECLYLTEGGESILVVLPQGSSPGKAEKTALAAASGEVDTLFLPYLGEGAPAYLRVLAEKYKIGQIILPRPQTEGETEAFMLILTAMEQEGVAVTAFGEMPVVLGGVRITEILVAGREEGAPALLLSFAFGDRTLVYYGNGDVTGLPQDYLPPAGALFIGEGRLRITASE